MFMLIGKTRTNQPVEGYLDAPVFDATIELKDGKEVINMETKDRDYIYENQPMVIGVRLPDEDDATKHQVIYLQQLIELKETNDAVVYQALIPDSDEGTIEQKLLTFLNDSDTIKASLDSVKYYTLPTPEYGDDGKLVAVNGDEDGYELVEPDGGTKLYHHYLTLTNTDDDDYFLELIIPSSTPINNIATFAQAMRIKSDSGSLHKIVTGFINSSANPNFISVDNTETKVIKGTAINSLSEGSYPVNSFADVVTLL